ncbi:MAG: zf-HC2 domain-containing protein [Candidatus Acidiferrales bacterium]
MTWTCEQTELRLSDYLEGLLNQAEQNSFDAHVNGCERCTPLVASVSHLLTNLHGMEELETPPRLVYSILDKTLGPRDSVSGWRAVLGWVRVIASPRFAYGAVSVTATLMVLLTASGFSWRKPKVADLSPVNVYRNADRQAHLVFARGSKFVSDLRVVYEIQSRLHQESEIPATPEGTLPESSPDKQPGRTDGTRPASPRQQNRANGIGHELEVLAAELPILAPGRMQ